MSSEQSNKNLWIIITVICIVVLAIGAYVALQDNQPSNEDFDEGGFGVAPRQSQGKAQ